MRKHMFRAAYRLKPYKRYLQRQQSPQQIEDTIARIQLVIQLTNDNHRDYKNGNNINDEGVATPAGNHVEEGKRGKARP